MLWSRTYYITLATRVDGKVWAFSRVHCGLLSITTYHESVELYFSANSIGEDKRLAILLSVIGPKTYEVLTNLLAPVRPQEYYGNVVQVLTRHFEPQGIMIAERFKFYHRRSESVVNFVAELFWPASSSEFGDFCMIVKSVGYQMRLRNRVY